ncbi:hypothetical protein BFP72_09225 [Reichenbachiella sp. 5M10]|nr:hypothetical protein BFP72_09225 [Reichenbachiella sp. 5M10]
MLDLLGQQKVVYVKIKEAAVAQGRIRNILSMDQLNNHEMVHSLVSLQVQSKIVTQARVTSTPKSKYLDGIYRLSVSQDGAEEFVQELQSYSNVVAVELEPQFEVLLVPNDEWIANQDYLQLIEAYEAWDITRGDEEIIIGVSDTGFDFEHEDMVDRAYVNSFDPINGVDDDGNGYIDDNRGWDFGDEDNDASYASNESVSHGAHVAGIVSATPNNSIGIAGVSYSSPYLPIKVAQSSNGEFHNAYESIIYAADMGCAVINLSWGGVFGYSEIAQSVINYAVLERNMAVVAAAGNTDAELDFYPASYDHVLSVGKSNAKDEKASNATWSYQIDLMAPGQAVLSTNIKDGYLSESGSSFSAPQVASTVALVKSVFPELNAIELMERVRMTADDIYAVGSNSQYWGQLGKGRLNVLRAVSEVQVASIRSFGMQYHSKFDGSIFAGDTVDVSLGFVNVLREVSGAGVEIVSESPYAEVVNPELVLGSMYSFDSINDVSVKVWVSPDAPADTRLSFRMNYFDAAGYEDFEYFHLYTAPPYVTIDNGQISQTIGANANLGYSEDVFQGGHGLNHNGVRVAYEMGIAIGNARDTLSNNITNSWVSHTRDQDFESIENIRPYESTEVDRYARGSFVDTGAETVQGLRIEQEFMLWTDEQQDGYMIQEYRVTNTLDKMRPGMSMGLYVDFGVGAVEDNFSEWNEEKKLGYCYSLVDGTLMTGVALLTGQPSVFRAIDLYDSEGEALDITEGFSDSLKYAYMINPKWTAGGTNGNDVAQLLTAQMGDLAPYSSQKVAFVTVFGYSLDELMANVEKAQVQYDAFLEQPQVSWIEQTCTGVPVSLENEKVLHIYSDSNGMDLVNSGVGLMLTGLDRDSMFYYTVQETGYTSDLYAMQVEVADPKVQFRSEPQEFYLGDTEQNKVQFVDETLSASSWSWDFGNGFYSAAKNPFTPFNTVGEYAVNLSIVTSQGCAASGARVFKVGERGEMPNVKDQMVCAGQSARITASNSESLRVYAHENDEVPVGEGSEWSTPMLDETTVYYVSSIETTNESVRVPVTIVVDPVQAAFEYSPDTTDWSGSEMIHLQDVSTGAEFYQWQIDGEDWGQQSVLVIDVSTKNQMEVVLEAKSSTGCTSVVSQRVEFATSTQPGINQNTRRTVCKGTRVFSQPLHGEYFVFYSDASLTHIVAKGSEAWLGPIESDTSFFITNVSDYHESNAVELELKRVVFDPVWSVMPEVMVLEQQSTAIFKVSSETKVVSYRWSIDDAVVGVSDQLVYTFFEEGEYLVAVSVSSELGCVDTLRRQYQVKTHDVLGLVDGKGFVIYPNPASDWLYLDAQLGDVNCFELFDVFGKKWDVSMNKDGKQWVVDVRTFRPGLYVYQFQIKGQEYRGLLSIN